MAYTAASHGSRHDQWVHARSGSLIEIDIAGILRDLAAAAVTADNCGILAERGSESDTGIRDGFASRNHGELGETVEMIGSAAFEIPGRVVIADFCAVLEAYQRRIYRGDGTDRSDATLNGTPGFGDI